MTGKVITFYSYKGGVGRSFALANVAVVLAQWGYRVLMVDWDIEAPGLRHYFPAQASPARGGVIDFLQDCRSSDARAWEDYAVKLAIEGGADHLYLMPAEAPGDRDYADVVQDLDWDELYDRHGLGDRIETLRADWTTEFDFVLVDSRTGVTDFSGLTTAQLPDVLAFMFTANEQSLGGCVDIARRAMAARSKMPVDRPAILPLPIPARFEPREEFDRAQQWRTRFSDELAPFFEFWAPAGTDTLKLVDLLTIPYVPRWTFGEELAVLLEPAGSDGLRSPGQAASYACETIAALLVHEFANVELLTSSRDEYVHSARSRAAERHAPPVVPLRLFLSRSADPDSRAVAESVRLLFEEAYGREFEPLEDTAAIEAGSSIQTKLQDVIETADAYIVIVDKDFSSSHQHREVDWIQRLALRSDTPKPIIPVVLAEARPTFFKSKLANYFAILLNDGSRLEDQLRPALERIAQQLDRPPLPPPPPPPPPPPSPSPRAGFALNPQRRGRVGTSLIPRPQEPQSQAPADPSRKNGWMLSADIRKTGRMPWFTVTLEVRANTSALKTLKSLREPVTFTLPPFFSPCVREVSPTSGRAMFTVMTQAPFSVTARVEQDKTLLELDLASLPDLPPGFGTAVRDRPGGR